MFLLSKLFEFLNITNGFRQLFGQMGQFVSLLWTDLLPALVALTEKPTTALPVNTLCAVGPADHDSERSTANGRFHRFTVNRWTDGAKVAQYRLNLLGLCQVQLFHLPVAQMVNIHLHHHAAGALRFRDLSSDQYRQYDQ